jgi:hypothetical protein
MQKCCLFSLKYHHLHRQLGHVGSKDYKEYAVFITNKLYCHICSYDAITYKSISLCDN